MGDRSLGERTERIAAGIQVPSHPPDGSSLCDQADHSPLGSSSLRGKNIPCKQIRKKKQKPKARVAILMFDTIFPQNKGKERDPEKQFIILKGRIHQEYINIINIYASKKEHLNI